MKIRTRFLLFLLPILIGSIALLASLFAYNGYKQTVEAFKLRLKAAIVTSTALIDAKDLEDHHSKIYQLLTDRLDELGKELNIQHIYFLPLDSPRLESIPKKLHITHVYKSDNGKKLMTGYAPLYDKAGHLSGLIAADLHIDDIDAKFQESLFWIILCSGCTIILLIISLFTVANKISRPIQKLNNSALALAAGKYEHAIPSQGPKEIVELSNTLNIMSECLNENINRLKENALLRERMYGEYECCMLLQHLMLQKNIDACKSDAIAMKAVSFFSDNPKGILLDFPPPEDQNLLQIRFIEAEEEGLEPMYELLIQAKTMPAKKPHHLITLNQTSSTLNTLSREPLFIWSRQKRRLFSIQSLTQLETGDLFFLCNQGLYSFLQTNKELTQLLTKVLNVFAEEGLETVTKMVQKEIAFLTKRKNITEDMHLLCVQLLN